MIVDPQSLLPRFRTETLLAYYFASCYLEIHVIMQEKEDYKITPNPGLGYAICAKLVQKRPEFFIPSTSPAPHFGGANFSLHVPRVTLRSPGAKFRHARLACFEKVPSRESLLRRCVMSILLQITPKMRLMIALFQSTPEGCAGT